VREGATHVAAVEPEAMLSIVGNDELGEIASQVREDLEGVVEKVARS
jgi:hypothetical protein